MVRILANDGIHPDGKTLLEEAGYEVDTQKVPQEKLAEALQNYDVLVVRSATKVRKELIDQCPHLKIVCRGGVGLDNIDVEHARSKGITVFNTPAASSQAVAELAFGHMFGMARFLNQSNRLMASSGSTIFDKLKKDYAEGVQLRGKTLGIIGFGRIGQAVARIGLGLGMNVLPADVIIDEADIDLTLFKTSEVRLSVTVEVSDFDTVISKSDFITLHVPFSGGKPLIGAEELAKMKKGVFIVNTARGGAIDEKALLEALNSGKVAGAGLDVFENEPTPMLELLQHPRVSLSPHIGAATIEAQSYIGMELAEKIISFYGDDK